ncbi:MAG: hypothetical protein ACK5O7_01800 [Holosporales bacterium]
MTQEILPKAISKTHRDLYLAVSLYLGAALTPAYGSPTHEEAADAHTIFPSSPAPMAAADDDPFVLYGAYPLLLARAKKIETRYEAVLPEAFALFQQANLLQQGGPLQADPHPPFLGFGSLAHLGDYSRARLQLDYLERYLHTYQALGAERMKRRVQFLENQGLLDKCHGQFTAVDAIEALDLLSEEPEPLLTLLQQRQMLRSSWDARNILTLMKATAQLEEQKEEILDWYSQSPWRQVALRAETIQVLFERFLERKETFIAFERSSQGKRTILRCQNDDQVVDLLRRHLSTPGGVLMTCSRI